MTARSAEVVGAGIAGLAVATALAQRGWSVRVHEKSLSRRTEGAGIYIWENGLRVLRALGAYEEAIFGCHEGRMRETRDNHNRVVSRIPYNAPGGLRVVSIVRDRLMQALSNAAVKSGVEIQFNSSALGASRDGELFLADKTVRKADLVVAADGVNSPVRDSLGLLRWRRLLGDGAMRFLVRRSEEEIATPELGHYIEYWSGTRRLLYTPCSKTELYLALTALNNDSEAASTPVQKEAWKASFPHIAHLIDRIDVGGHFAQFEEIRLKRWSAGRVAIIGDAAHAQAPNLGQGGGCALMNGLALAVWLEKSSLTDALERWERNERPLIQRTQRISTLYGKIGELPDVIRSSIFWGISRSRWATAQRLKAASHHSLGTN